MLSARVSRRGQGTRHTSPSRPAPADQRVPQLVVGHDQQRELRNQIPDAARPGAPVRPEWIDHRPDQSVRLSGWLDSNAVRSRNAREGWRGTIERGRRGRRRSVGPRAGRVDRCRGVRPCSAQPGGRRCAGRGLGAGVGARVDRPRPARPASESRSDVTRAQSQLARHRAPSSSSRGTIETGRSLDLSDERSTSI